jgi:hypothetical protein
MAEAKVKTTTKATPAAPSGEGSDMSLLERTALEIYKSLAIYNKAWDVNVLAKKAFQLAAPFEAEANRVLAGGKIETFETTRSIPEVVIFPWVDSTQYGVYTKQEKTDDHGRRISVTIKGDPNGEHPNLPPDHPHNQQFFLARDMMGLEVPSRYHRALADHKEKLAEMVSE